MTKLRVLALLAVVALVLVPAVALAQAGPPSAFYGKVQVDGQDVSVGTVITATVGNETYTTTTPSDYGPSTYSIRIAEPEGKSYAGKTVTFMIGNRTAVESAIWEAGGNVKADLTAGVPRPTPIGEVTEAELLAQINRVITERANELKGPKGDTGAPGLAGLEGEQGKDAPLVLPIVALVLAIIAVVIAGGAMRRKPPTPAAKGPAA